MPARFAVGIDLGTTNTVVASAPLDDPGEPSVFETAQLVGPGEVAARSLFPSLLYAPVEGERADDPFGDAPWALGEIARRRASELPGRVVASSKSWLVHSGVDRTAPILPWGAPEGTPKLSPVEAAQRLLAHVCRAWDDRHPGAPLASQQVVLAVPASFDEAARELTVEAARRAGFSPSLIEEPQAAFYDWIGRTGESGLVQLASAPGDGLVLVVDVGGGTTDLSLMRVAHGESLEVSRVAVGPHLLLGGDNMDLALAHSVEPRFVDDAERLDPSRFAQLVAACRLAKESLLGASPPDRVPVTVTGTGARLVGNTRTAQVERAEAERTVVDGFMPVVERDATLQRARGALIAFGLPYERDVAITRHVAAFLRRYLPAGTFPSAVLLNGGVFRATRIAERLVSVLESWRGAHVERLAESHVDLAVARGGVAYGRARLGRGIRIGGGSARGYFVGVASGSGPAKAVCVVPRGAEEGTSYVARGRTFALAVGRPVRFEVFASDETGPRPGDTVDVVGDAFVRLPPVATELEKTTGTELSVTVEGELTPIGTLELACVEEAADGPRRFRLAFQLNEAHKPIVTPLPPLQSQPPRRLDSALDLLDHAFGKPRADATERQTRDLLRELEKVLGERSQWNAETNRAIFDALIPNARARRRSAPHERIFWLLAGWCLRPGFGDALDPRRITALTPVFEEKLAFPAEARGWRSFFIAWRRVAGGVDEATQTRIRDFVDPLLSPPEAGLKKPKRAVLSLDDALDTASSLERVVASRRSQLGGWVLERTWTDRDPRLWAAIGRLGARVPAYASVHHVVIPAIAERWLDHLLREKWDAVSTAPAAAVALARKTGDRARDVSDRVAREVEKRLVAISAKPEQIRAVREVVRIDDVERAAFFVDTLPMGLRLVE